jgi:histidinol-phosphatase (PHP family)
VFRHNFHTHTHYCDGSAPPVSYIRAAIETDFCSLGFSSHAPVPLENNFAIKDEKSLADYCSEINKLKAEYDDRIKIYLGIEADYIPGESYDFDKFRKEYKIEYVIGSVHLVKNADEKLWFIDGPKKESWKNGLEEGYGGNIRRAVTAYYDQVISMVETQRPEVIGHLDKVKMHNQNEYFREDEKWYRSLVSAALDHIARCGCIVEVNTRGLYKKRSDSLFPGMEVIIEMFKRNIPVTISTDAHMPEEINSMQQVAVSSLLEAGYREVYIFEESEWVNIPL